MPSEEIKVGSVVKLKSGGPEMVVQSIFPDSSDARRTAARCAWFTADDLPRTEKFVLDSLEVVEQGKSLIK